MPSSASGRQGVPLTFGDLAQVGNGSSQELLVVSGRVGPLGVRKGLDGRLVAGSATLVVESHGSVTLFCEI